MGRIPITWILHIFPELEWEFRRQELFGYFAVKSWEEKCRQFWCQALLGVAQLLALLNTFANFSRPPGNKRVGIESLAQSSNVGCLLCFWRSFPNGNLFRKPMIPMLICQCQKKPRNFPAISSSYYPWDSYEKCRRLQRLRMPRQVERGRLWRDTGALEVH